MNETIKLKFTLEEGNFDIAGLASSKIKKILRKLGIRNDVVRRIVVASYEAEINVIIHSLGGKMEVIISPQQTEIQVNDFGPGISDINLAMTEGFSTANDYIRGKGFGAGMGLPNMRRCSDKFEIKSDNINGTHIIMIIYH